MLGVSRAGLFQKKILFFRRPNTASSVLTSKRFFHLSSPNFAANTDPYQVLGLPRSASADDIKKKYRELAKKYHPDLNKDADAADKMAAVASAYETLGDPQKRQMYDQTGMSGDMGGMGGPGAGFDESFAFSDFADLFGFMNGRGAAGRAQATRGESVQVHVPLSFLDAVRGCSKEVVYDCLLKCKECSGSGAKPGTKPCKCKVCQGTGMRQVVRGPLVMGAPCTACSGSGEVIECPCKSCKGSGLRKEEVRVKIDIPAGVEDQMQLRLMDHGHAGAKGGPRGHLFVTMLVEDHAIFKRKGANLHVEVNLPYTHPLLGGTLSIPTLDGSKSFEFPKGSNPDIVKRLPAQGVPVMDGRGAGDLFVHFKLQVPNNLTDRQIEILKEFRDIEAAKRAPLQNNKTASQGAAPKADVNNSKQSGESEGSTTGTKGKGISATIKNLFKGGKPEQ